MRGASVWRSFTFEEERDQDVRQAAWVWFDTPAQEIPTTASSSTLGKERLGEASGVFGPFRMNPPPPWTDDPLPLPNEPLSNRTTTNATSLAKTKLERYLVIFLNDIAYAYPPSGGAIPFQLPFQVNRVWALEKGLLIQRAEGGGRRELGLPMLYSLLDPKDEMKVVSCSNRITGITPSTSSIPMATEPTVPFQDHHTRIIYTSDCHNREEPIFVSISEEDMSITVWVYATIPQDVDGDETGRGGDEDEEFSSRRRRSTAGRGKGKGKERATGGDKSTTRVLAAGKRKRHSVANTSQVGPGDRSGRRASGGGAQGVGSVTLGGAGAASEEADLLEALGESMGTTATSMRRTASAITSIPDRRGSVTRNELSITMDRMALGVAGGGAGNLHGGGEMDREATLFFSDLEETSAVSDVYIQSLRSISLEGLPLTKASLKDATACLFDSRGTSSTLAIHIPSSKHLFILPVTRDALDGTIQVHPPQHHLAQAITPVTASRENILDLLVLDTDFSWCLLTMNGAKESITGPTSIREGKTVLQLEGDGSRRFIATLEDGLRYTATTSSPPSRLENLILQSISLALNEEDFITFRKKVEESRRSLGSEGTKAIEGALRSIFREVTPTLTTPTEPWRQFLDASKSIVERDSIFTSLRSTTIPELTVPTSSTSPDPNTRMRLDSIVMALHLLAEDAKLDVDRTSDFEKLVEILLPLVTMLGLTCWVDYYLRGIGRLSVELPPAGPPPTHLPTQPPSLIVDLGALLANEIDHIESCFTAPSVAHFFGLWHSSNYYGNVDPIRTTHQLIQLYEHLSRYTPASTSLPSPTHRSQTCVLALYEMGWDLDRLGRLRFAVALPIREAIRMCQYDAPEGWPPGAYELIRRPDLSKQAGWPVKHVSLHTIVAPNNPIAIAKIPSNGVGLVYEDATKKPDAVVPPAARFNEDRRVEEVGRILQFAEPVTISAGSRSLDQLTPQVQQSILNALSHRTLALPTGFAMFKYHSKVRNVTESVAIPRINTSARILPMPSPVALLDKEMRDTPGVGANDRMEWPDFHSGVAAALQLRPGRAHFDSAQISFNKPADLDARHAGFLMGLGLTGHIGSMVFNQAFDYLKAKHDPTSIGLLLGLAVTYLGTGDPKVTSLLSVHLAALHPPNSSQLNVSGITQAAGLVGIGLLYLGSGRRTLADVMIRELCSIKVTSIEEPSACREAYALSAGFAFGMIMLGRGTGASQTPDEVELLSTFRALTLGENNHPLPGAAPSHNATDVNITSSAATIATGLMYLKTERQDVASILEIPDTARRLDYVRSDLLLLRTLARSLIMWNTVASTKAWVESHVPQFITDKLGPAGTTKGLDADLDIARWNIIAGACFGMGLRFAGSAAVEPHATLIYYLDRLTRAAYVKAITVQGKIKRHAIRCCLSVVATSLAMVMAGTGEINVMRRLRVAHGHFSEGVTYGTHLASHMALGLLFVGAGHYSLGTSNTAIASLLIAFYPSYPSTSTENRAHLQAYRHLWTLAVEPRCLEVRDVDTNEPAFLPVRLKLVEKQGLVAKSLVAPTLIPEIHLIDSILIDSPRYWAFTLRIAANSEHRDNFLREAMIYVKRKTGHLSYGQDPRGIRSIFTRSKSETGSAVFDFGEMARLLAPSATGLRDFVSAFSEDPESKAAVIRLCQAPGATTPPTAFEAFCASALLECLTRDKRDLIAVYHSIYSAWNELNRGMLSPSALLNLEQLRFMVDFYQRGTYKVLFTKMRSRPNVLPLREPLVQSHFVDHVLLKVVDRSESIVSDTATFQAVASYLKGDGWPLDPSVGLRLAAWLALERAPPLAMVEELRSLTNEDNSGGLASSDVRLMQAQLMEDASAAYDESGNGRPWSLSFTEMAVNVWSQ